MYNVQEFWADKKDDSIFLHSYVGMSPDPINSHSAIPPGQSYEFKIFNGPGGNSMEFSIGFMPVGGGPSISASVVRPMRGESRGGFGWELPLPASFDIDPTKPPHFPTGGGGGSPFTRIPITVKLFRPDESEPVRVWAHSQEEERGARKFEFPETTDEHGNLILPNPETMKPDGWWRCVITHSAPGPHYLFVWSRSFLKKANVQTRLLSYRWVNHALENVLATLTPRAKIENGRLQVGLLEEVGHHLGVEPYTIDESTPGGLDDVGLRELRPIVVSTTSGLTLKAQLLLLKPGLGDLSDEQEQNWQYNFDRISDDALVVKITPVFSDPKINFSFGPMGIVSGEIFVKNPVIYIAFSWPANPRCFVNLGLSLQSNVDILLKPVFHALKGSEAEWVNDKVAQVIGGNGDIIREYFYSALGRACGRGGVVDGFRATPQGWEVKYYDAPIPDPNRQRPNIGGTFHDPRDEGGRLEIDPTGGEGMASGEPGLEPEIEGTQPVNEPARIDPMFGVFPAGFEVTDGGSLAKLDKIKTIFVIMMENRSFDHFLGFLSTIGPPSRGGSYRTFPPDFSNPGAGSFLGPIYPVKAKDLGFEYRTPVSPQHEYDHVLHQISDGTGNDTTYGAMQGFISDIMTRLTPSATHRSDNPALVMSYYEADQLKTYKFLAENFKVLDQWFAAHPGPTWPNRIATVTGQITDPRNFELDDHRIGFLPLWTIFDTLNNRGVDWAYLESNVGILRLFDRYRTDIENVIPMRESDQYTLSENRIADHELSGLDLLLGRSELPRVVFIDPRFSDAPPLKYACDDLAPCNIENGQRFISSVCDRLFKSRHWDSSMLLITYDEHGGFFDHVPPPGTSFSGVSGIERLNDRLDPKDSPNFLGVRVPAILVSPYVDAKSVTHNVFDHTSIIKTILVHNRKSIAMDDFRLFGKRVMQAEHLGVALDSEVPRGVPGGLPYSENDIPETASSRRSSYYEKGDPFDANDFHETLNGLFKPRSKYVRF